VARFLSEQWVAEFNVALRSVGRDAADPVSVRTETGSFTVEEQVAGVPGRSEEAGPLRVVLRVADEEVTLSVADGADSARSDVVVSLSYDDAAALSRGELDPTEALSAGRVRVRGDLAVLVAGQGILARAAATMGDWQAETTY
jgi:SCP-2 sterol transfer family protein